MILDVSLLVRVCLLARFHVEMFNSPVQQQFSSLVAHFDYQIPSVFLCFVTEFGFSVT